MVFCIVGNDEPIHGKEKKSYDYQLDRSSRSGSVQVHPPRPATSTLTKPTQPVQPALNSFDDRPVGSLNLSTSGSNYSASSTLVAQGLNTGSGVNVNRAQKPITPRPFLKKGRYSVTLTLVYNIKILIYQNKCFYFHFFAFFYVYILNGIMEYVVERNPLVWLRARFPLPSPRHQLPTMPQVDCPQGI